MTPATPLPATSPAGSVGPWQRLRETVGLSVLLPLGLALLLIGMSRYSFLLFHTFAELFAVIVGLMAFMMAWSAYPFSRNNYLMILGTGYFWIAILDLLHTMTYKGMTVFPAFPATHPAAQLWIAARCCEALLLVSAPLYLTRPVHRGHAFILFGTIATSLFALIATGHFPDAFVAGEGLTTFKVLSEYFIMATVALAMTHLWIRRGRIDAEPLTLILLANTCTICAEFSFTLYINAYGLSNLAGHIFKLFAFFFVFLALVRFTLKKPFEILAAQNVELRIAEERARQSEHDLATVLDNLPALVGCWDRDLRSRFGNRAYREWFGITEKAMRGMDMRTLLGPTLFQQNLPHIEAVLRGEPQIFERDIPAADGSGSRHTLAQYVPDIVDGTVQGFYVLVSDMTVLKQLENDRLRLTLQLQQAQKMEAIGHLTGGIAHDFNNILGVILGYSAMALERHIPDKQGKLAEYLRQIERAGQRAKALVDKMLVFARGGGIRARAIDAREIAQEVVAMLRSTLPTSMELTLDASQDVSPVSFSPDGLHQVIANLAINARDAMNGQGHLKLSVTQAPAAGTRCNSCHGEISGQYVTLQVTDNGPGIPAAAVHRIFDPFYTTKGLGKGTGLGLSMVHGLVHEYGGHITMESVPGKSTTFRILLPVASGSAEAEPLAVAETITPAARFGQILVVDDEPSLAELMSEVIEIAGYQARRFTSSTEALAAFRAEPQAYVAMLSDQTMPGMTGLDLLREVRAIRPDLPVFIASGYSDVVNADNAAAFGVNRFFQKPVVASQLVNALNEVLGERP
jgi:PAS domain S-box-containing protein